MSTTYGSLCSGYGGLDLAVEATFGAELAWHAEWDDAPAVSRWERLTGRTAPHPAPDGRLSPAFVEWMMGLPAGWVTGRGLSRTAELKMLGNGVVPQQATAAIAMLLARFPVAVAA